MIFGLPIGLVRCRALFPRDWRWGVKIHAIWMMLEGFWSCWYPESVVGTYVWKVVELVGSGEVFALDSVKGTTDGSRRGGFVVSGQ